MSEAARVPLAEEDEEGRFFGGGLTSEQKQILNIFDSVPSDANTEEVGKSTLIQPVFVLKRLCSLRR